MLQASKPKVNKDEQEFISDYKDQQKLLDYLRENPNCDGNGFSIWSYPIRSTSTI